MYMQIKLPTKMFIMYFAFSNSIGIYVYELLVSMNFSKLKKYLKKKKKEKRHTPRMPPG